MTMPGQPGGLRSGAAGGAPDSGHDPLPLGAVLALFAMLSATTILSQFLRFSTGIIAPELVRELTLSPEMLGLANGAFYIALFASQVPVGIAFDRIGPRITVSVLATAIVAGGFLHMVVETGWGLVAARLLFGLGCGASFMSAIVLCSRWFPPYQWSTVLSWVFGISQLGTVISGTPMAIYVGQAGWRSVFLWVAVFAAVKGVLFYLLVRDRPPGRPLPPVRHEGVVDIFRGFLDVLRIPGLKRIFAIQLFAYSVVSTVIGLWASLFLHDVHGLDAVARGNVLVAMAVAQTTGTLCAGPLDRIFNTRKWAVVALATLTVTMLGLIAAFPTTSAALSIALLIALCFFASYGTLIIAHSRSHFPEHLVGRGATVGNMCQVVGSSTLPVVTGFIPALLPSAGPGYSVSAYQAIFALIAISLLAGLAVYMTSKDVKPR